MSDYEHELKIYSNGDFRWADFLRHLSKLGNDGSGADILVTDGGGKANFYWDGDGADKIHSASIDGKDIFSENASMNALKLVRMLEAEKAAVDLFSALSSTEKSVYLKAYSASMFDHIKKGALHKQEGIPEGEKIPVSELEHLKEDGTPLEKKRANWALNVRK
jgi:hypothetical protein